MGCQEGVESAKLTTVMNDKKTETTKSYDTIKLGIDANAKWYYVARQLDGATPQPEQKMELDGLLHFVAKQQKLEIAFGGRALKPLLGRSGEGRKGCSTTFRSIPLR